MLHKLTQLSFKELDETLISLTADRQSILTMTNNSISDDREPVFGHSTLFIINKKFLDSVLMKDYQPKVYG